MRAYNDAIEAVRIAILAVSLLSMAAYWKWHLWWLTGFGRARMAALLSVAALAGIPLLRLWTGVDGDFSSSADDAVAAVEIAAFTGVLTWVTYMLVRIIAVNVHRVRHPADAARQGREHLKRTPGATAAEIEKLTACWEEMRTRQRGDSPSCDPED